MGCCGGSSTKPARRPIKSQVVPIDSEKVQVEYTGRLDGSFNATAQPSGTTYYIPGTGALVEGPNAVPGVYKQDVPWFLKFHQGRDFRVVQPTKAPAKAPVAKVPAKPKVANTPAKVAPPVKSPAMNPNLAVDSTPPVESYAPDPVNFTVRQLVAIPVSPDEAAAMLKMELTGRNRKTVVAHLEAISKGG